jgi:hypothetical protein
VGSTLGAPTAQYFATALGGHTLPETVVSNAAQSAGLKWSFHNHPSLDNFNKNGLQSSIR